MKCDRCDNEATVHEVRISSGKSRERHLCESCAKSEGLPGQSQAPINALLTNFITSQLKGAAAAGKPKARTARDAQDLACPTCGCTHSQFRQTGLLGCPDCYAAFEGQLGTLVARAHDGGTQHSGKSPARVRGSTRPVADQKPAAANPSRPAASPEAAAMPEARKDSELAALKARCDELKAQLAAAVAAERYEKAAELRDELSRAAAALQAQAASPASSKAAKRASPRSVKDRRDTGGTA